MDWVKNGKPKADSDFVELTGDLQPVESVEAIGVKRRLGTNEVHVWGNGSNLNARIAIANPPLFASRVFKEILENNGIVVEGKTTYAGWAHPALGESSVELAFVESAALSELTKTMNKESVNLFAELMIRTLGRSYGKSAPDTDPKMNMLRGDDNAGAAVIQKWLADNNISSNGTAIHDGSGLSRLDRITPELIVRVLALASQSGYSKSFTESLPVAGRNGTLSGRLKSVSGKIAAKTGSVQYVNSLAGYANRGSETFAFAIICNDETIRKDSSTTIDRIVSRIVTEAP
jgi:D-alanyl-D-alanine carboxypeptidase/D-alanyl-D-alanine-endopeptidase (penicillin-binding protein 4)